MSEDQPIFKTGDMKRRTPKEIKQFSLELEELLVENLKRRGKAVADDTVRVSEENNRFKIECILDGKVQVRIEFGLKGDWRMGHPISAIFTSANERSGYFTENGIKNSLKEWIESI